MKRILFNFFGQLRFWELQNTIESTKNFFKEKGYTVHIHGTFWNDEYTINLKNQNKLNIFDKLNLIEEPKLEPFTLQKYFYSLEKSIEIITNSYDFIISSRPDILFELSEDPFYLDSNLKNNEIYIPKSHYKKRDNGYWIDDKFFICNFETLNLISKTFRYFKEGKLDFNLKYHIGLVNSLKFFNITVKNDLELFRVNLIRHYLYSQYPHKGDSIYKGELVRNIEKQFQDSKKWIEFIQKIKKGETNL